ncbi:TerC/Alx family metal homeostasis membrane protein [Nesterenkonia alkaliphila]|uniref:TerC/Alx family metal homeostasis membrane protein n=1 Tax=Nesterenkonia alkaliphila TaxID=1463631 RepID=A0A7K1UEY0_9MICC|nr:TerC/Alx family metal homeostasis membrane protein [Nesterenkonia alkaliphila]GFZ97973.1 putative membrane protein [Nesterenkonia alkaliphila]
MEITPLVWVLTIAAILALLAFDFFAHVRKAHEPTLREAAVWSSVYIGLALMFGLVFLAFGDTSHAVEYYAGYLTEKALSVDNLFVFLVIISSFGVPRKYQQKVLLFGIIFALVSRTVFILLGAGLIHLFSDIFYLFGLILLVTAANMLRKEITHSGAPAPENAIIRLARRWLKTSESFDGDKLTTRVSGRRVLTPMLLVMVAIGGTDILFALDSIPAIYGLTHEPYIVFTATAFSLMGLRQLYFLIDGLLQRLVFLSYGLIVILGFIAVKLVLHALHENNLPFINGGQNVPVPEIPTGASLIVILVVLAVTVAASLWHSRAAAAGSTALKR